jgi:hypothetical protein
VVTVGVVVTTGVVTGVVVTVGVVVTTGVVTGVVVTVGVDVTTGVVTGVVVTTGVDLVVTGGIPVVVVSGRTGIVAEPPPPPPPPHAVKPPHAIAVATANAVNCKFIPISSKCYTIPKLYTRCIFESILEIHCVICTSMIGAVLGGL